MAGVRRERQIRPLPIEKKLAQEYTQEAVEKLVSTRPPRRTRRDRRYGRSRQLIEHDAGENAIDLLTIIHRSGIE